VARSVHSTIGMQSSSWVLGSVVLVLGCATPRSVGAPEGSPEERKQAAKEKQAAINRDNVEAAGERQRQDVDVDLTPQGMAARIRAPEHAEVKATPGGVEVRSGDDYHLFIGRGVLDVLGEKGEIVEAYGADFEQFLEDDGKTVVWQTKGLGDGRFHFFASYQRKGAGYHCRTGPDGAPKLELVRAMIDACRDVKVVDATTLAVKPPGKAR
jgi:hypothetical protein